VSSTVAGLGTASAGRYTGVAPGATVYSFKTDAGVFLLNSYALRAFDWILTHPEANIRVSSNSWGSGDGGRIDDNWDRDLAQEMRSTPRSRGRAQPT
jgi:serine protease AprX